MTNPMQIEEIILKNDIRGISLMSKFIDHDSCKNASNLILNNVGTVFITTGFFILSAKSPETDGPPGAIFLGNALETLGYRVTYITDKYCSSLLRASKSHEAQIIEFPIMNIDESKKYSEKLLQTENPNILISIERCGASVDYKYRNMKNEDISDFTAKIDYLFNIHPKTIGIGDGGNEIGMGNIKDHISKSKTLVDYPTTSEVTNLIISSVSNWGAYGLLAAISIKSKQNLLPSVKEQISLIKKIVDLGAVDGFSGTKDYKVDGKDLEENTYILKQLHQLVDNNI